LGDWIGRVNLDMVNRGGATMPLDRATVRVLALLARGLTTGEVAERLDTTPERVRAVLAEAMVRLGAGSPLEAVVVAIRRGLIEL
jgi:DNA-binding NarL/FixJ family response regulator